MLENNLFYKDEYMQFSFKDIHSSRYNLYITNDIDDLKIFINSEASIEYTTPKYQNSKIVLGVTRPQRNIPLSLVAYGLTRQEILKMTKWIKVGEIGELCFDFAKDWVYDTIISEVSDLNIYPLENDTFMAVFDTQFSTLNGTAARNTLDAVAYYGGGSEALTEQASAYNNEKLKIPSFNINKDDSGTYIIDLFYLGDGCINLNINHSYEGENKDIELEINCPSVSTTLQNFSTKIKAKEKINETIGILTYSQRENLFFIDYMLPEQQESHDIIGNLITNLSYEPLILKSPGAPVLIQDRNQFEELISTPFNWAICSQAVFAQGDYATGVLYPFGITAYSDIIKNSSNFEWNDNYINYYFVYYDTIQIKDISVPNLSNGILNITQYTEAI